MRISNKRFILGCVRRYTSSEHERSTKMSRLLPGALPFSHFKKLAPRAKEGRFSGCAV